MASRRDDTNEFLERWHSLLEGTSGLISLFLYTSVNILGRVLRWRLRIPFELRILPVFRELYTFEYGTSTGLGIKKAEVAGPLLPLPYTFHGRLKSPFAHFPLALLHWHIVAVKGYVLHTLFSGSLRCFSFYVLFGIFEGRYLVQVLRHQALPACRLHDFESQIAVFREAHLELERACLATKITFWDGGWRKVEDLERTNAELKQPGHRFLVIASHDAYLGY